MTSIELKVSTPWESNLTEDAHEIIQENLNKLRKEGIEIASKYFRLKAFELEEDKSEAEIYGFWANKKRIVTYATFEYI